jgi:cell division protein ZapA
MSKVAIKLYGKDYTVNCDPGQEDRLQEIVQYVEELMGDVAGKVGNTTETRLLMLTCLRLADQLFDARTKADQFTVENEELLVAAVEHLNQRVAHVASMVGRA